MTSDLGIVVIGRNEGERLHRCIRSLESHHDRIVYVDSASGDDSVAWCRPRVASVVELDPALGLSAARARNAGAARLTELAPDLEFVQFVDGDCEVDAGWLEVAHRFLAEHPKAAVVCGRRREIAPEASPYNRLADIEWNTPVGRAQSCGGDAMMRIDAFREVGGFAPELIAGEEPELCIRLRAAGYEVHRINAEMTRHDAALRYFSQWWTRNVRSGYASIELVFRHGRRSGPDRIRRIRSIAIWGLAPLGLFLLSVPIVGWGMAAFWLGLYPALACKIAWSERRRMTHPAHALLYGGACALGKIAELQGCLRYLRNRLWGIGNSPLIEYKGVGE